MSKAPAEILQTYRLDQILNAAREVIGENGYDQSSVDQIAKRAGLSRSTVYEYFSSKEELLFAVFESVNQDISSRMNTALSEGGSTREKLLALLRLGAEVISEQVDLMPVMLDFWAASRGKDFEERYREAVVANYDFYRKLFADFIRGGQNRGEFRSEVDAEALAATVVATVDGLGIQLSFDRSIDPHRITETFGCLLYESLTSESP